jgi:serine/threonine protein kinase
VKLIQIFLLQRGHSEKELRSLRQEFEIQQHLHHPNIIQMLDSFETENEVICSISSRTLFDALVISLTSSFLHLLYDFALFNFRLLW